MVDHPHPNVNQCRVRLRYRQNALPPVDLPLISLPPFVCQPVTKRLLLHLVARCNPQQTSLALRARLKPPLPTYPQPFLPALTDQNRECSELRRIGSTHAVAGAALPPNPLVVELKPSLVVKQICAHVCLVVALPEAGLERLASVVIELIIHVVDVAEDGLELIEEVSGESTVVVCFVRPGGLWVGAVLGHGCDGLFEMLDCVVGDWLWFVGVRFWL